MLQFRGYAAKLRRCSAPKVMEFDYLMRRVSVVASMNVKSVLEISVPQCLTTDAAVKVDFHSEVTKGSAKVQLLGQMKLLQSQNKHSEVLQLLSSAKKDNIALINNEIISLSVVSASAVKQPHTVVALIDLGQSQGVRIRPELALAYIKSCKMCASDSQPGMWSKAVGMLETILVADMKESGRTSVGRKLKSSDLIAQCFEEAALLCASSRKWRNVLDIIEKCAETNHPLTERMLSAAIVCCAREINGIENAHNLFRYMAKEEIRRSTKVYTALLQGFLKAGMLDKYEAVWAQMKAENLPCTDVLYATRIEAYAAASETEKAELTLEESLQSIKRPKVSYNALYLTLLKAGSTQKALNLVKMMREAGVQPPEQHSASFHVQSLSKLGLIEEGLRFLRSEEEGYYTQIATAKEVADTSTNSNEAISLSTSEDEDFRCVNDAAWQALFKGSLVHGNFRVSEELLDLVIEKYQIGKWRSSDSSPSPADSNLWLSQLCRAMGKAGQWREALSIADRHRPLSDATQSALLRMLCQCIQTEEAIICHRRALDELCATSPSSNKVEKFLRNVSHGFIQQLASENKGESALQVFDDLHISLAKYSSLSPRAPLSIPSSSSSTSSSAASEVESSLTVKVKVGASLPMMYTSAIRYTVGTVRSLQQAQRIMEHQRLHGVTPMWSCTRYAMKVMSEESAWDLLLDVFAARAMTSDYLPGDELAYTRALKGCRELGRWQESVAILADLLSELDTPGSVVFELTLEVLAANSQWEMMTEVVKVLKDRQVVPTPLMTAVCTRHVPAALRDQLLRKLGEPPSPKGTTDASKQSTFKGTQRLQKQKKMKKIQKLKEAAEESSTNAASEVQGSDAADSSDQGHRQMKQETKKNAVKCGI